MPRAVQRSINQFLRSLTEAVLIVLAVSLVSLGLRTGLVVAVSIPLVLAVTFLFMWLFDIGLHKISLGALILSLGLLVDDAIIAVEMMAIKLEQGFDRFRAASFAYTSTAFPDADRHAGHRGRVPADRDGEEQHRRIHALDLPGVGDRADRVVGDRGRRDSLPRLQDAAGPRRRRSRRRCGGDCGRASRAGRCRCRQRTCTRDPTPCTRRRSTTACARVIAWCVGHRMTILVATLALFVGALALFRLVPQQFFPASSRVELLVDLRLPEGSSFAASLAATKKLEAVLDQDAGIESYVAYVGSGSPRFYLPLDQQLQQSNFAQVVLIAKEHRGPRAGARAPARAVRRRFSGAARAHLPARERTAGRIPGAVPRVGRECRDRAHARATGRRRHAQRSRHLAGAVRLGRAVEGHPRGDRPEQGARARHFVAGPGGVPQQLAVGLLRHLLPRARQADRGDAARRGRRARADELPQGPRDSRAQRPRGADHADRRHPVRTRGRHRLAAQPAADHHRALRRARRRAGSGRRGRGSNASSTRSAPACRSATASSSAAPSRTRRAGRSRSPPACRCSSSPC